MRAGLKAICGLVLAAAPLEPGSAQDAFFKGKQIRILISAGVSGGYSEYARLLSKHMGNHIAGRPAMVVQSMPGAGGLLATNYLYSQAPQDGTTIGLIHSTVPLSPLFGSKGARFDPLKFHWLGSLDRSDGLCTAWFTSPVKTWADMLHREFIVGSSGAGSQMDIYPAMLNKLFKTKIRVVGGYKDGGEIFHAMERGEIEGRCSPQLTTIQSTRPHWLSERKIMVPILIGERRNSLFPDTPAIMEFAKEEAVRAQVSLLIVTQNMDRPLLLPPGVTSDRVKELRAAFNATVADPAFRADADRMRLHLDPVTGEDLARQLAYAYALPAEIIAAAKETMGAKE
ncbi:MAG: hypothetical protein IT536_18325 [Hyphomicrobiales bacterium]|nr:hypothetical protein [Hyphomicrobiales bacterium]